MIKRKYSKISIEAKEHNLLLDKIIKEKIEKHLKISSKNSIHFDFVGLVNKLKYTERDISEIIIRFNINGRDIKINEIISNNISIEDIKIR